MKPKVSPTIARFFFEGIAGELAQTRVEVERANATWQRFSWRLIPAPTAVTASTELSARAYAAGTHLAAALEHFRQLDAALTAMRATIPIEDPHAERV